VPAPVKVSDKVDRYVPNPNTAEENALAQDIWRKYVATYLVKESLGVTSMLSKAEEYWGRSIVETGDEDNPGSNTNIIFPVIESQVADIVGQPQDLIVEGIEPSDEIEVPTVKTIMEWFVKRNDLTPKKVEFCRGMLSYGSYWWRVTFDPTGMKGRGFIDIDPINPANMFPDPKIRKFWELQKADFIIVATSQSTEWLVRRFGDRARAVRPMSPFTFSPSVYQGEDAAEVSAVVANKALLLEYWTKDSEGNLRLVYTADDVILYDSEWDKAKVDKKNQIIDAENAEIEAFNKSLETWDESAMGTKPEPKRKKDRIKYRGFYRMKKYPFVCVPCYPVQGHIWGKGDVEMLIPVQDLVNDLDDQIRMNARLMGNIQIVVGLASGINLKKWTNKPGLKLPARDHTAFQVVQPPNMPSDVPARREIGKREAEIVSGRSDVTEGRTPKGVRAASAVIALQEAGNKRANMKKMMIEWGLSKVIELVYELYIEHFDVELPFRLSGPNFSDRQGFLWHRGTDLQNIPRMVPGLEEVNPQTGQKESKLIPLMTTDGGMVTKEAEFDFYFSIGAGLPSNKAFLYQAAIDTYREGLSTREEGRKFLKDYIGFPYIDPINPLGNTFMGNNVPGRPGTGLEQQMGQLSPGPAGQQMPSPPGAVTGQFDGQGVPPQIMQMLGGL
jgi:hypothetical protein